jgi:GGDEF domain-containing protein
MSDTLTFSPAAWVLLEMLQQQTGLSLEVVHVWLHPVRQGPSPDYAGAIEEPAVADAVMKAVRTGEVRVESMRGLSFGAFPLRRAREVVGCLIVSWRPESDEAPVADPVTIERTGALARAALESDLLLNAQVLQAQGLTRRLHGILRFLGQLGTYENDREVMHAVLQAATVWFDLDCRIYQRQPDGGFALAASLPGAEHPASAVRLEAPRAQQLIDGRRFPSAGDLDDLGLSGRRDEVLALPVGIARPEWLILLAGPVDANADLTFTAIARVLGGELQARELARLEQWQDRLGCVPLDMLRTPERVMLRLLEELAADAGAQAGRLTLLEQASDRTLAAVGAQPAAGEGGQAAFSTEAAVSPGRRIRLDLWTAGGFGRAAAASAEAWVKAVRPWLGEALATIAAEAQRFEQAVEVASFERRIQEEVERAKRFNLGLSLVLIGADQLSTAQPAALDAVAAAVRPELRASDLLGRIRGGVIAVLLVHSGMEGAESVTERVRQRLASAAGAPPVATVQVGRAIFSADCASADALISQAIKQTHALSLRH